MVAIASAICYLNFKGLQRNLGESCEISSDLQLHSRAPPMLAIRQRLQPGAPVDLGPDASEGQLFVRHG